MSEQPITFPVPAANTETTMDEERDRERDREERRSGRDRRENEHARGWSNPAAWGTLFAVLITVLIAVLSFGVSVLIDTKKLAMETRDMVLVRNERMDTLRRDVDRQQNQLDVIEKAYQYNVNYRLTYIEAKTGVKAPPPPPKGD